MTYHYALFSQDFSESLLSTTDKAEVEQFLRDSGHDWLPIRVEWGQRTWKERWSGRLELHANGVTSMHGEAEYLKHLLTWPVYR